MKYIKTYSQINESYYSDTYNTLKDILLELADDGFLYEIRNSVLGVTNINIYTDKCFPFFNIKSTIDRIINFIGNNINGFYWESTQHIWYKCVDNHLPSHRYIYGIRIEINKIDIPEIVNESKNNSLDTYNTLKDILLELEDDGFKCHISNNIRGATKIYISKQKQNGYLQPFHIKDVNHVLDRIINLLGEKVKGIYYQSLDFNWYNCLVRSHMRIPAHPHVDTLPHHKKRKIKDLRIEIDTIDLPQIN